MGIRPSRWPLATRLIVLSMLAMATCTGVGGWLLRDQLHATVLRNFENVLMEHSSRLSAELVSSGILATRSSRLEQGEFGRIFSGWYWVLEYGDQTYQSRSAWDSSLQLNDALPVMKGSQLMRHNGPRAQALLVWRTQLELDGQRAEWYVMGPAEKVEREWRRIGQTLWVMQLALALSLLGSTILAVSLGLRPLRRLQEQLVGIDRGRNVNMGQGFGPDLDPLAVTLDHVLQRNARMVDRAHHQAADLSHALKKPLAVLNMEAQQTHVEGQRLREHVHIMSRTIDRHLARFASGAGSVEAIDAVAVLKRLVDLMQKIHAGKALRWTLSMVEDKPVWWRGAASDLEEMAGNLLDNAGKWASTQVVLTVMPSSSQLQLQLDDDGPGLSESQIARACDRGQRFDERPGGHGLGLAIVQDIAETYGGQLVLSSSSLGGLRCTLSL